MISSGWWCGSPFFRDHSYDWLVMLLVRDVLHNLLCMRGICAQEKNNRQRLRTQFFWIRLHPNCLTPHPLCTLISRRHVVILAECHHSNRKNVLKDVNLFSFFGRLFVLSVCCWADEAETSTPVKNVGCWVIIILFV